MGTQVAAASTAGLSHPCSEANSAACADGKIDGQTSEWGVHQAASKAARHGKAKGGALLKRQSKQASFPYTAMPSSDSSTPDCPPERGEAHHISEISRRHKVVVHDPQDASRSRSWIVIPSPLATPKLRPPV